MTILVERIAVEPRVWAMFVETFDIPAKLSIEQALAKHHQDHSRAFAFEAQNETFNECDAAMLAHRAGAECDSISITPTMEGLARELLALAGDDVLRCGARGATDAIGGPGTCAYGGVVGQGYRVEKS